MIKILYAAGNYINSRIQLSRFLENINDNYKVKVAAYKKSSPNINIDWTLDCLHNMFDGSISFDNEYFRLYCNQIKYFAPDIIISDLDYATTHAANLLNIPIWQCSASLLDYAIDPHDKYNVGLYGDYEFLFKKTNNYYQRYEYIIGSSEKSFVSSCFCDIPNRPTLTKNIQWVRPYFVIGDESKVCHHNIVAASTVKNNLLLKFINGQKDSVLFGYDDYMLDKFKCKDLTNDDEFACNIFNCNTFIHQGHSQFISDAFYNGKYSNIIVDLYDRECVINAMLSSKFGLCNLIYDFDDKFIDNDLSISFNDSADFLHKML